jgi:curved DNA-binding protein CbpA
MPAPAWTQLNCYQVLRVHSSASPTDVKAAYRARSKETHPDFGGSHEAQVQVNLAYEVLSDPIQRQQHDRYWAAFSASAQRAAPPYQAPSYAPPPPREHPGAPPPRYERPKGPPPPPPRKSAFESLYNRVRADLDREEQSILARRQQLNAQRADVFVKKFESARSSRNTYFGAAALATVIAFIASVAGTHWLWLGAAIAWVAFSNSSRAVQLGSRQVPIGEARWRERVTEAAHADVEREIRQRIEKLRANLANVASLQSLLSGASTFDDSEEQVARRIAGALFLMGYQPTVYDREGRMLLFSDGDEKILVRYRHRSGAETNVAYVRKVVESMRAQGVLRGFLFCTPGLSHNGAQLARQHRITWYSLETMNSWIDETCRGSYAGPGGNIINSLSSLIAFLGQISIPIPQRSSYSYRRRYRRY